MSEPKIKFLVPVAFSPQSDIIIEQACNLAMYYDAMVTMLYVLDTSKTKGLFSSTEDETTLVKNAESKFGEKVREIKDKYKGLEINSLVIEGKAYEAIVTVAKSIDADIIIMGASGAKGLKSQFIGSNTMKTIKQSPCPVITIRGKQHRQGCKNIVLPLDLTKDTTQKLEYAIELAQLFGDSVVRIVSIIWDNDEKIIQPLTKQIRKAQEKIHTAGVECTAEFVKIIKSEDTFAKTIIAYANKVDADLIMIMTQQESNPTEFFIGSSAQSVISNSDVPVMSIVPRGMHNMQIF